MARPRDLKGQVIVEYTAATSSRVFTSQQTTRNACPKTMLGPNVTSHQCSMSCNQHKLPAMLTHAKHQLCLITYSTYPIRLTLITKPCELNKSQNHAGDLSQPIQPSQARKPMPRSKPGQRQTRSQPNYVRDKHFNTANYVRDKHQHSPNQRQPRSSTKLETTTFSTHVRDNHALDIHAVRDKHDSTYQHLPKSTSKLRWKLKPQ
jgi:hypothetical protein